MTETRRPLLKGRYGWEKASHEQACKGCGRPIHVGDAVFPLESDATVDSPEGWPKFIWACQSCFEQARAHLVALTYRADAILLDATHRLESRP